MYSQNYSKGKVKSKIKIEKCSKTLKGTEISFIPDKGLSNLGIRNLRFRMIHFRVYIYL